MRAIPLVSNWRFMSPDILVHVLGGTGGSDVAMFGKLKAYYLENKTVRVLSEDWWSQFPHVELLALGEVIRATKASDAPGISEWRKRSLHELPAAVFVWKDDYQALHEKCWRDRFSKTFCALRDLDNNGNSPEKGEQQKAAARGPFAGGDSVDDDSLRQILSESLQLLKRWEAPDYHPFMAPELSSVVLTGFETHLASGDHSPATTADSGPGQSAPVVKADAKVTVDCPTGLSTSDIAYCFSGLQWNETDWKKNLGKKPKWLASCISVPGAQGEREISWNPILVGGVLVHTSRAKQNSVRAKFQTVPLLRPWLDEWKTFEADNFESK